VLRELFFGSSKGSALLYPKVGLSELLIQPAVDRLKYAHFRYGEPVRSVEAGGQTVHLQTDVATEGFDFAIRTDSTVALEHSPIVNAYFWLDREVLRAPIAGFIGTTLQWAFPKPTRFAKQMLALTVSAATAIVNESTEIIRNRLWDDLRSAVPEARGARLVHYKIIKEKRATPLFTPHSQGHRPKMADALRRVFLAGDYVQNGLPATIEGAVRNGFAAAAAVQRESAMD
jgi:hypothetical protein